MTQDLSPLPPPPPHPPPSSLSFSQGFLLGQLSILLLLAAFLKFFIFGDAPFSSSTNTTTTTHARRSSRTQTPTTTPSRTRTTHPSPLPPQTLLSKTNYDPSTHAPESLDWFNVLLAQAVSALRADAHAGAAALTSLTAALNGGSKPAFLDEVRVTDLGLGGGFPVFRNCRVGVFGAAGGEGRGRGNRRGGGREGERKGDGDGMGDGEGEERRLQARMDVDLSDEGIALALETKILLNYPQPRTAVLPVALSVSVVRFSGTLSVSFLPSSSSSSSSSESESESSPFPTSAAAAATADPSTPPPPPLDTSGTSPTTLSFAFLPDYELELSMRSLVGSRSRLQDVPKIAQIVESRLRAWFEERWVVPRVQVVVLPTLWPRERNIGSSGGGGGDGRGSQEVEEGRWEGQGEGIGGGGGGGGGEKGAVDREGLLRRRRDADGRL